MVTLRNAAYGIAVGLSLALMLDAEVAAQDIERGRRLFENHCRACHKDTQLMRQNSDVKNVAELRQRITGWATHMGDDWRKSEIDDVLFYLNSTVYRFKEGAD